MKSVRLPEEGGKAAKKAVHAHEAKMHQGQPKVKLKIGKKKK